MKIYFCDKCNESIPIKAIEANRISIDAGKIYCEDCAPTKPSRSRATAGLWTVAVAVLFGGGLGVLAMTLWGDKLFGGEARESMGERLGRLELQLEDARSRQESRFSALEAEFEVTARADGSRGKMAQALGGTRDNGQAIQDLRRRFDGLTDDLRAQMSSHRAMMDSFQTGLEKRIDLLEDPAETRRLIEDFEALRDRVAGSESELDRIGKRLEDVARNSVRTGVPVADATTAPTEAKLDAATEARLQQTLAQLDSKDAPKRFNAIVDLASIRCRRAEEAMVKALDDSADYVRTTALQNLMDLEVRWSIPNVIKKLADEDIIVREAAIAALEKLTGRSVGLDATDTSSKIAAKMRELETWWTENRDRLLTS
ncbi:MAG: HEAT repeat domain-containing protein [Planctomycetes bacterium]|nr:HEAT repeat domain-containing protein [Planctomycetota bacterium]